MKELMLGNAAVARGLYEAGCRFVSSYPGTPSTEITEKAAEYDEIYAEWASNEKVALESAVGASLAGARSFTAMKHVGLNVAADPLFTAAYVGVNAGLVVCVADDPAIHSSQNEQDSRHYARAAKLPMLEPADSAECLAFAKRAFDISEQYDTPVLLRTVTRIAHSQSLVETSPRVEPPLRPYAKDMQKYVAMPAVAVKRHVVVEEHMEALRGLTEKIDLNREEMRDPTVGFVASGAAYQYVREAFPQASVFKIGMVYPLPVERIRAFAAKVDRLYVIEELDPFIETALRAAGIALAGGKDRTGLLGELSQYRVRKAMGASLPPTKTLGETLPGRPPVMCAGCPHRGLFTVLSRMKLTVFGDIGCYTLGATPPLSALDTTLCMGASFNMLHGYAAIRPEEAKKSVAVLGDSTFIHSGITGVVNTVYNLGVTTMIVLDNAITGMTGHQQNPTTGMTLKNVPAPKIHIEKLCEGAGVPVQNIRVVDPGDMKELTRVLREELAKDAPSVVVCCRPCALLKYVKHKPPVRISADKCRGCRACMKLGCPALRFAQGKVWVDETQCVGCGLCAQTCGFGAIEEGEA